MAQSDTATRAPTTTVRRRPRWFYFGMGIAAILVVIAGFGKSFYGTVTGTARLSLLVNIHAFVFGAWLILFLVQTMLVATGKTAIHRRLGVAAAVLAVGMIGLGYQTAITAARHGYDLNGTNDPLGFLVFALGDVISFTILVGAGFWYRRRPEVHKRLMLLVTVGPMMGAPLAHLFTQSPFREMPLLFVVLMAALLFAGAVYDRFLLGRFHPVSLWGAVVVFAWGNLRNAVIGPSEVWHKFAAWLIS